MKRILTNAAAFAFLAFLVLPAADSSAKDVKGSKDHPLVSRYEGAVIARYETRKFDEYSLLLAALKGRDLGEHQVVEGRITKIVYEIDKSRTTLEVFKNYESALSGAGFETLFSCKNQKCKNGHNFAYAVHDGKLATGGNHEDQRFLTAKLTRPEGTAYVSLYVVKAHGMGGPKHNTVFVGLDVIEAAAMETDKVTVDAEAMGKGLDAEGHIAIYGIYFDSGSDTLKAESNEALAEIAKLMKSRPDLNLLVVGHTDNQGKLAYNMDLSKRRAAAVVKSLTENHGIKGSRLTPAGVGFLAPVASNRGDEGRALNRRVVLVER